MSDAWAKERHYMMKNTDFRKQRKIEVDWSGEDDYEPAVKANAVKDQDRAANFYPQ